MEQNRPTCTHKDKVRKTNSKQPKQVKHMKCWFEELKRKRIHLVMKIIVLP